jgi:hypothetical protein
MRTSLCEKSNRSPLCRNGNWKIASRDRRPVDNIGFETLPDYAAYAAAHIYKIQIPGCPTNGRVFVGQRKDPFVVNLGETFDLINIANPIGESFANAARDDIADKNVRR